MAIMSSLVNSVNLIPYSRLELTRLADLTLLARFDTVLARFDTVWDTL